MFGTGIAYVIPNSNQGLIMTKLYKSDIKEVGNNFHLYYILRNNSITSGFTHHRAQFSTLERAEQYLKEAVN